MPSMTVRHDGVRAQYFNIWLWLGDSLLLLLFTSVFTAEGVV